MGQPQTRPPSSLPSLLVWLTWGAYVETNLCNTGLVKNFPGNVSVDLLLSLLLLPLFLFSFSLGLWPLPKDSLFYGNSNRGEVSEHGVLMLSGGGTPFTAPRRAGKRCQPQLRYHLTAWALQGHWPCATCLQDG